MLPFIVFKYDLYRRFVGQYLGNHHESLCIRSYGFAGNTGRVQVQCLREIFRRTDIAPCPGFKMICPDRVYSFKCHTLHGAGFHIAATYEPDSRQRMAKSEINRGVRTAAYLTGGRHQQILLVGHTVGNRTSDGRSTRKLSREPVSIGSLGSVRKKFHPVCAPGQYAWKQEPIEPRICLPARRTYSWDAEHRPTIRYKHKPIPRKQHTYYPRFWERHG